MPTSTRDWYAAEMNQEKLACITIAEARIWADSVADGDLQAMTLLENDSRSGVRQLAVRMSRRWRCRQDESNRQGRLLEIERRKWGQGVEYIAGVDEVGRGCLAGPVVAAAVVLPRDVFFTGIDDSKKLSPERRQRICDQVRQKALAVGIGRVEPEEIDRVNILQAALKAMRLALVDLGMEPQCVLVDGQNCPNSGYVEEAVINGDALSLSIAAASVVAKVFRDRLMVDLDFQYPEYKFSAHKGYGSAQHLKALGLHGPCPLHRRTFGPVADYTADNPTEVFKVYKAKLSVCRDLAEVERMGERIREVSDKLSGDELKRLRDFYRQCRRHLSPTSSGK